MAELPTGTVTMLFSDIEGSTLLLSRLGPAYAEALDAQRKVLREAWAVHDGTELGTEGDSFFVVFPTAPDAVGAAIQAQRELASYPWPGGEPIRPYAVAPERVHRRTDAMMMVRVQWRVPRFALEVRRKGRRFVGHDSSC